MAQIPTSSQGKPLDEIWHDKFSRETSTVIVTVQINPSSFIKVVVLHSRSMPLPCMKPILFQKVTEKKLIILNLRQA